MLFSYLFKTKCKIDEKLDAKGIQNNGISFLNLPNFTFRLPFVNGNIFVKTVYSIRKYNKIFLKLLQIKFLYLIFIKIFAII